MSIKNISSKKAIRLLDLCLKVNALGKDTVFLDYFGHVNTFSIDVHRGRWVSGIGPDEQFEFYVNKKGRIDTSRTQYAACLECLEGLLHE